MSLQLSASVIRLFLYNCHSYTQTLDTLEGYSQIIHIRSYQFEPLTDNTKGIESFKSKVHGTLTRSDNEKTPN